MLLHHKVCKGQMERSFSGFNCADTQLAAEKGKLKSPEGRLIKARE